jgi:hypothetical protein
VPLLAAGAVAEVTVPDPVSVLEPEPAAVEAVPEAVEAVPEAVEAVPEAVEAVPESAAVEAVPEAVEAVPEAVEVTGAVTEDVPELEPVPELVPAEVVPEPVPVLVPALGPVTAEVTVDAAEVTGAVTEDVPEPELARLVAGLVAAFACREKTSKTTRMPTAAIATCIARRAMSRTIGCGISSSCYRDRPDRDSKCPSSAARNTRVSRNSGLFFPEIPRKRTWRSVHQCTHWLAITVQRRPGPGQGLRITAE